VALIGFFKVIYIPLTVLYLIAAYVLLAKQSLSKIFKRTNFDLFRGGVLALYYFFIAMVFFVNIMLLTTKTVVKQQFLVPYIVGIIAFVLLILLNLIKVETRYIDVLFLFLILLSTYLSLL